MVYFKFSCREGTSNRKKDSMRMKIFKRVLGLIIPLANPDFSKKIDSVCKWLIEYDNHENFVNREIGLDRDGNVIVKMPYKNNYGFWIDTNLKIEDFHERFDIVSITPDLFYKRWDELL